MSFFFPPPLKADREREERRRALGGPDYDPHAGNGIFDPLSSPSEENSRSEEVPQNYSSYLEGGSSPTSPDAVSPPIESFDLDGDTSDTSPENDASTLKLRVKEVDFVPFFRPVYIVKTEWRASIYLLFKKYCMKSLC